MDSQGATEAAPKNQSAEVIIDITSSGETIRANHLKVLQDGLILASQAMLCVSHVADWSQIADPVKGSLSNMLGVKLP